MYIPSTAQLTVDFSASQSYNAINSNSPWQVSIYIDNNLNNSRSGQGAVTDVVSIMGLASNVSAGNHSIKVVWFGSSNITLKGSTMRVIASMK
jgi:hypothetical protein